MNQPASPKGSSKPRLHMLDALRGVCAVLVMLYHYLYWNGIDFFQIGLFAVYIFFILSGFSMWYVYADNEMTGQSVRSFYVSRFARIFPLYLLVNWEYMRHGFEPNHLNLLLLNTSFLFGFASPGITSGVTGGWSIGIEWVFYVSFPLLWACLRDLRSMLVILVLALIINQMYVAALFPQGDFGVIWGAYTQFPVFIVYFIAGIIGADLFRKLYRNQPEGLSKHWQLFALVAVLLCLITVFFYPSDEMRDYLAGWHFPLLLLAGGVAVFFCSLIQNIPPKLVWLCKFLGDVSFSTYLTHYLVFKYGTSLFAKHFPGLPLGYLITGMACTTITIAYLLYRFYEMPARQYINKMFGGHRVY